VIEQQELHAAIEAVFRDLSPVGKRDIVILNILAVEVPRLSGNVEHGMEPNQVLSEQAGCVVVVANVKQLGYLARRIQVVPVHFSPT